MYEQNSYVSGDGASPVLEPIPCMLGFPRVFSLSHISPYVHSFRSLGDEKAVANRQLVEPFRFLYEEGEI